MIHRGRSPFALRSLVAGIVALGIVALAEARPNGFDPRSSSDQTAQTTIAGDADFVADGPKTPDSAATSPPATGPLATPPAGSPPAAVKPPVKPNPNAVALANPPSTSLPASTAPSYSLASIPHMIGDVLGAKYFFNGGGNISLAGGDRAAKIADDSSPLPVDRVFFDYNYFSQANVTSNHVVVGLDRYTLGFEKTFLDGLGSVEIKAPIDSGLASNQNVLTTTSANEGTVFGDLTVSPKFLLFADSVWAASAGATFDFPTAPRAELFVGEPVSSRTRVMDNSVHVEPFLGLQIAPCERLFSIAYLQLDMDANGNEVLEQRSTLPFSLAGRLRDPTVLYVDFSAGYWLFHDEPCESGGGGGRYLTGLAPVIELHYAAGLQNAHPVDDIRTISQRSDILNLTSGVHFELGRCSTLTLGCAVPLRTLPRDKEFDTELIVELNRRF